MIRLLLVDDQSIIRQGLTAMLRVEPDLQVVGTADNGQTAIEQVAALQPNVVLMDIRMPVMDGVEATRIICQRFAGIKILVLTTFDNDQYLTEALKAGARGYLLKDLPSEELADAIRSVHRGYAQLESGLLDKIAVLLPTSNSSSSEPVPSKLAELTPREREVLRLIVSGASNREMAQQLYVSEGTIKNYVSSLLSRLNLRNRAQLAIYANAIFKS